MRGRAADGEQREPDRRREDPLERQRPRRNEAIEEPDLRRGVLGVERESGEEGEDVAALALPAVGGEVLEAVFGPGVDADEDVGFERVAGEGGGDGDRAFDVGVGLGGAVGEVGVDQEQEARRDLTQLLEGLTELAIRYG